MKLRRINYIQYRCLAKAKQITEAVLSEMAKNKPTEKVGQALTSIEKNSVKSGSMENNMMAKDALKQNSSSLPKARENTFDGSTSTGVESKVNYPFGKPEPDQEPLKKTYDKVVEEIKQLSQSGDQFQNDMRSVHNHSQDEVANHLQGLNSLSTAPKNSSSIKIS